MAHHFRKWSDGLVLALLGLAASGTVNATCDQPVGAFVSLTGAVDVQPSQSGDWTAASLESRLCEGDTIRVGERSRAAVSLINDAVLRIDQNTAMRLIDITPQEQETSLLDMFSGAFQSFSRKPKFLKVNTPYLNGSVEGTEFVVRVENESTSITVLEGRVVASNDQGEVAVQPGEAAQAKRGQAPTREIVVNPRDQVQWALYYPPILSAQAAAVSTPALSAAANCTSNGNIACALAELDRVPADQRGGDYLLLRSSVLLTVGRVDEARADIDAALRADPNASGALALRSVIGVSQNRSDEALADAQRAVEADLNLSAASIALSYALQAKFDIVGARDALQGAADRNPDDALVWARLAETQLMLADRRSARASAERAVEIDPNLGRTQSVLGFTALAEIDSVAAQDAFEQAIMLDTSDPMSRLGRGLAKISQGDLAEGRADLEAAVALASNNALLRAYLGKAYFEEKRGPLDATQFEVAKQLDPNDPTAYFYDAITKQTTNRPVEALRDMQTAIELNDNRAVYRSRLLLDSDRAARGASLARIYSDLGFQQLGLVEGWKSVNVDPSNSSAHRFLADTYAVLPRHEIARVSELLKSQLLQPLNSTPIQPSLAESNLFLISALGPAAAGFNEFNRLFTRDGLTFQANALLGGNDTRAGEAIVSGIHDNVAFSVGGFSFDTDGFRPNADQATDLANAFVQFELSPATSIQAEYRYKDAEWGDLRLNFFPEEFYPGQRVSERSNTFRLGARHDLSPNSTLLGSVVYVDAEFDTDQNPWPPSIAGIGLLSTLGEESQEALSGEIQHLYRSHRFNLTTGIGYFNRNGSATITTNTAFPPPYDLSQETYSTDLEHTNLYAYSNVGVLDDLTMTLGLSADITGDVDEFEKTANDSDQFNPKFGLMWTPTDNTLVRLAAFRAVKRPVIANQTLEPTQVAGFNQFFDDYNNTVSRRYGAAIDQTFGADVFGGLEVSRRDMDVPSTGQNVATGELENTTVDWQEELARAYIYWTPLSWLGLSAEYQFERVDREVLTDGVKDADTHRLKLGMKAALPSGWNFTLTPTYYRQKGTFESIVQLPIPEPVLTDGEDDFWVVDAGVSYRLPKRRGMVSLGVTNLFDKDFMYFDTDHKNMTVQPGRVVFASLSLALP